MDLTIFHSGALAQTIDYVVVLGRTISDTDVFRCCKPLKDSGHLYYSHQQQFEQINAKLSRCLSLCVFLFKQTALNTVVSF